ncbi:MAG: hypothetical protein HKP21_05975 [Xanthomonadales bacterium]|nr:hypothetical protein [Gammaproteobacteria bacterium]NNK04081.1 hypothetical protein [Xanthomonadales bacterium]
MHPFEQSGVMPGPIFPRKCGVLRTIETDIGFTCRGSFSGLAAQSFYIL